MFSFFHLHIFLHQILRHVLTWSWKTQSGRLRLSQVLSSTISGLCEKAHIQGLKISSVFKDSKGVFQPQRHMVNGLTALFVIPIIPEFLNLQHVSALLLIVLE